MNYISDMVAFLLEEKTDKIDDSVGNPKTDVASEKKDIKTTSDVSTDSDEQANKEDDDDIDNDGKADDGDEALDDLVDEGDDEDTNSSGNGNDDDETTSPPHEESNKFNGEKLVVYAALKEIKISFEGTLTAFTLIFSSVLPEENVSVYKSIKQKIQTNISLLDEFLNDIDDVKRKSLKELTNIYKIYYNDLKIIDSVLKSHNISSKK